MSGAEVVKIEAINTVLSCVGLVRPSQKARVEGVGRTLALIIIWIALANLGVGEELGERGRDGVGLSPFWIAFRIFVRCLLRKGGPLHCCWPAMLCTGCVVYGTA